jgi:putative ABC transport system substrate-binding protein
MPAAKRIFVVYDPRQNAWLLRLAKEAASARGLELVAYEAADLKTALRLYQEVFATVDARRDVLWLPQDSTTVDESSVLPLVLQEAWSRSLAVFSSSVVHVRRGALFSLYPDNIQIGRGLAVAAQGYLSSGGAMPRGVTPLKTVLVAVNVRTANHLGLDLAARQQNPDLVFPEQ